jgi:hypothetical protein
MESTENSIPWPSVSKELINRLIVYVDEQRRANGYSPSLSDSEIARSQATLHGMNALITKLAIIHTSQVKPNERQSNTTIVDSSIGDAKRKRDGNPIRQRRKDRKA